MYKFKTIIEESVGIEQRLGELYFRFHTLFPDDGDFWLQLVDEEIHHAALVRGVRQIPSNLLDDLIEESLPDLIDSNEVLEKLHDKYEKEDPTREEAFNVAYLLEGTAAELHYQQVLEGKRSHTEIGRVFRELNGDDRNHAERIHDYMVEHKIKFFKPKAS